jgi:methionyl-tRNA formyltransferase
MDGTFYGILLAVKVMKLVQAGLGVRLVVTQPDRPKGRGLELALSPVKQRALQLGLPVSQPDKIKNNEEFRNQLAVVKPDTIIVVGYGRIIPAWMLDFPPLGNLNLHVAAAKVSGRGAGSVGYRARRNGDWRNDDADRCGLATGDILLQKEIAIAQDDTAETLAPRMARPG